MLTRWIEKLVPRLLWRHRANSWGFSEDDAEFSILPDFVERRKLSLDVGGAGGTYTAMLIPLSKRVVVFEPIPSVASKLRTLFAGTSLVSVEQVALSDTSGVVTMRVPTDLYWRGTIEPGNRLRHSAAVDEITVTRRTIDEYALDNVGFVKIDVEGHELAVLLISQ